MVGCCEPVAVDLSLWAACFMSIAASIGHSVSGIVGRSLCWSVDVG